MSLYNSWSPYNAETYIFKQRAEYRSVLDSFVSQFESIRSYNRLGSSVGDACSQLDTTWTQIRQLLTQDQAIPQTMLPDVVRRYTHASSMLEVANQDKANPSKWLRRQFQDFFNFLDGVPFPIQQSDAIRPLPNISPLGLRTELAENITYRWEEAMRCFTAEAYLSCIVMLGGLLEGLLLGVMQKNPSTANQCKSTPRSKDTGKPEGFSRWTLNEMITVARECSWLDYDAQKFSHALRDYRNLIHPHEQIQQATTPDDSSCRISFEITHKAVSDLLKAL